MKCSDGAILINKQGLRCERKVLHEKPYGTVEDM